MRKNVNGFYKGLLVSLSLALGIVGCNHQTVSNPMAETTKPLTQLTPKTQRVHFKINFGTGNFQTKQTAQANFVRVVVTNGTQTVVPNNADAQGYIAVSGASASVGADVPNGNYWVATSGMYTNKSTNGLIGDEVKSVFHVPGASTAVDINLGTLLSASIIESLRELDAAWLGANSPNLNNYKAFTDNLTGLTVGTGGALSFSRMKPTDLDPRALAIKIKQGTIANVTGTEGTIQNPQDYKKTPYIQGVHTAQSGSSGIYGPATVDDATGTLYYFDASSKESPSFNGGNKTYSSLYAVTPTATQLNQTWKIDLPNNHTIISRYLSLGAGTNRLYGIVKDTNNSPNTFYVRAFNTTDGSTAWTFNLPASSGLTEAGRFAPLTWRNRNGSICSCDWGPERVFVAYNSDSSGSRGVYALNETGAQIWFYAPPNAQRIWSAGALSKDATSTPFGAKLYVLAQHDAGGNKSKLIALDTITGTASWVLDLGTNNMSGSAPVIGTDGTIYVLTYDTQGYLEAINPDGTRKWATPYPLGANPYAGAPIIDRQNGKDVIFVPTADYKLHAIYDDKTAKWATPMSFPQPFGGNPVLGAEPDGSHVIYIGQMETDTVLAIRDKGTAGQLIWQFLPGASLANGFALRNGKLFGSGFGGGDGQDIRMSAIRVFANNAPTDAPWPMAGATLSRSGRKAP